MANSPAASIILLYHRMGSVLVRSTVRGQYIYPWVFRAQLRRMVAEGYQPAPLTELLQHPEIPGRVAVTFDDAYTSVLRKAWPILVEMKISVTIFAVAALVGKTNRWDEAKGDRRETLMDAAELRDLAAAGVEIGSHTLTHANLPQLSDADLRAEVCDSKHVLEDLLGQTIHGFSYPYGAQDARVRDAVVAAGYRYATATTLGVVHAPTDPFALPRMNMRWNTLGPELKYKIKRAYRQLGN